MRRILVYIVLLGTLAVPCILFKASRMPYITRTIADHYLDEAQGTSQCVDDLEALYGEGSLVQYGRASYTIEDICDFE